jgi:hypothetical protein
MNPELKKRIDLSVNLLIRRLGGEGNDIDTKNRDNISLRSILLEMAYNLHDFNFYPSDLPGSCCEVAFFSSLMGRRWDLEKKERLSFEEMYKLLISHCQGECSDVTKVAVIITDNWDDNVAEFWQPNISRLKKSGVVVQVYLIIGHNKSSYEL